MIDETVVRFYRKAMAKLAEAQAEFDAVGRTYDTAATKLRKAKEAFGAASLEHQEMMRRAIWPKSERRS